MMCEELKYLGHKVRIVKINSILESLCMIKVAHKDMRTGV